MPVAATKHTPAGATAFTAFFFRTVDWAYATTSTAYMRHYFETVCTVCVGLAEQIDQVAAKKWYYDGDRITVRSVTEPRKTKPTASLVATLDVTASAVIDPRGDTKDTRPPATGYEQAVDLQWNVTSWTVVNIGPV